jgi:4-amino-4-deoxy-L-arabinose transferase-like glycosyltransferase
MKKKVSLILLIAILLLAAFLRLYMISDYMTFLGDEGRDMLVAKGILEGDFTLLGPRASAGDFFLGPIYYYMIAPWLWLFRYDPVGPSVMVGLLSVVTTWLIYFVGKKWFNQATGMFAAALYAVSPVVINYSHSSWNPNVLPFFSLLLLFLLVKAITLAKATKYFIAVGLLLGIALQLHYLALFLGVVVFFYVLFATWYHTKKFLLLLLMKRYLQIFVGFLIGFSPFLAFEIRHGFPNIKTIGKFIFSDTAQKGYETGGTFFSTITDVFFRIFAKLVFYFPSQDRLDLFTPAQLNLFGTFVMVVTVAALITLVKFTKNKLVLLLLVLWLFFGVLLFGFYKKAIYDYYFTFLFPLPFFIIGNFFSQLTQLNFLKKRQIVGWTLALVLFGGVFLYNLTGIPFLKEPNRQKEQARTIAKEVIKFADNKPYNFALISQGNSDHAYRYFLEVHGHEPVRIENMLLDPERKTVTDQLVVVCEEIHCQPLGHPLFDVAAFGRASVAAEANVIVVKVFKLVAYEEEEQNNEQ